MERISLRLAARIGLVLATSLILRAEGCLTEERTVEGTVPVTVTADWLTQGYTQNSTSDTGNAAQMAQRIFDGLDDVENAENIDPELVTVAGVRARIEENRGHSSARTAEVFINGSSNPMLELRVPDNDTGTEVTASDDLPDLYLRIDAGEIASLEAAFKNFLNAYLANDLVTATNILSGISWEATWSTDDPPTQQNQDDFDWVTEIILHVPAEWNLDVINI